MAEASTQQLADVLIAFLPSRRGIALRDVPMLLPLRGVPSSR